MMGRTETRRNRLLPWAAGLFAVATLLWAQPSADAAWDGNQAVQLGDQFIAEFRGSALVEVHKYTFFAPKDALLSSVLTVRSGTLVPEFGIYTKADVPVDLGAALAGNKLKNFKFAAAGEYYVRVRATSGTGEYQIATKVKLAKSAKGSTTTGAFAFDSRAGTLVSASVKASKGSTATPTITNLSLGAALVDLGAAAGTAKFARITVPTDGTYTLNINPGTAGQSVDVKLAFAVKAGRLWSPGYVEDVSGLASENRAKWLASPHGDRNAMAFNDWNDTNPQQIPTSCAKCHSTPGYRDFLGADGSAAGVVNSPAPVGTVVDCDACHNDQAAALTSVTFPSGLSVSGLGKEARCMVCHQGRESTVSVEAKITTAKTNTPGLDDDTPNAGITFLNVHYFAAGASLYGREAAGAYEYAQPGGDASDLYLTGLPQRKAYDRKFTHVASMDTCIECHDPHSQQVKVENCASCHVNRLGNPVANYADLKDIRMAGTINDFDGDGDASEGIALEISGLQATLYAAMQDYSTRVAGSPLSYDGAAYPYFFVQGTSTRYASWTARLLRAAYNYQYSVKDPGAFAHNGKFIIEFLYDSIEDLNTALAALPSPSPVPNFANLHRNDSGHFDSSAEAYRHWDEDTDHLVDASCARCHSIEGFQFVAKYGIDQTIPAALASGLSCESCHTAGTSFAPKAHNPNADDKPERIFVASAAFPYPATATSAQIAAVTIKNGAKGTPAQDDSFICMTCHRGRESKLTLDAADPTGATATFTLSFKNAHYLGAGATLYGSKAAVMYQYTGKTYVQRWDHDLGYSQPYAEASGVSTTPAAAKAKCSYCHMEDGSHSFEVEVGPATACGLCHPATSVDQLTPFGRVEDNYDNDPATKPKAELAVFQARLLAAIQNYCKTATDNLVSGANYVIYAPDAYPYFAKDTNKNGIADPGETASVKFDTKSFRATFNYNFSVKEPGSWAHNPKYVFQVLYDSIQDLGGNVTGLTRP